MESKVSQQQQQHLAQYFTYKDIELTSEPLENMMHITSQGHLGCLLQHCTITGVAGNDDDDDDEHIRRSLTTAFSNLKQRSPTGSLASLCLRVSVRDHNNSNDSDSGSASESSESEPERSNPSLQSIWATALRTFTITMAALHAAQLPVASHLDIYSGGLRCSLVYDALLPLPRQFTSSTSVFSSLKELKVSLSSPFVDSKETTPGHSRPTAHGKLALRALLDMSAIMPQLECLDVHWYNTIVDSHTSASTSDVTPPPPPNPAVELSPSHFTSLKACTFRGIYISSDDLFILLKALHLTSLILTDIRLTLGTYASIFDYLALPDTTITDYHLDDLRQGHALVHFDVPGTAKFPYRGATMGPSTLTRQESEAKETIAYRMTHERPLGSGELWR